MYLRFSFDFFYDSCVAYSIRILRYKLSSFLYLEILRLFAGKRRERGAFLFSSVASSSSVDWTKNFSRNNSSLNELCDAAMTSPNFFSICWRFTTQFASHDIQRYCWYCFTCIKKFTMFMLHQLFLLNYCIVYLFLW